MLNPFRPLEREHEFVDAARAGVFPAGWLGASYILLFVVSLTMPASSTAEYVAEGLFCAVALPFLAFLGWRIWGAQPFWASVVVSVWVVLEIAGKLLLADVAILGLVISMIAGACCVLSLRGSWNLRKLRAQGPSINPTVFD